jgi:hypothetical protein
LERGLPDLLLRLSSLAANTPTTPSRLPSLNNRHVVAEKLLPQRSLDGPLILPLMVFSLVVLKHSNLLRHSEAQTLFAPLGHRERRSLPEARYERCLSGFRLGFQRSGEHWRNPESSPFEDLFEQDSMWSRLAMIFAGNLVTERLGLWSQQSLAERWSKPWLTPCSGASTRAM